MLVGPFFVSGPAYKGNEWPRGRTNVITDEDEDHGRHWGTAE